MIIWGAISPCALADSSSYSSSVSFARTDANADGLHDSLESDQTHRTSFEGDQSSIVWGFEQNSWLLKQELLAEGFRIRHVLNHSPVFGFAVEPRRSPAVRTASQVFKNLISQGLVRQVEPDSPGRLFLQTTSKRLGLRPHVWDELGLQGDPRMSIAVVDTGIDPSHAAFQAPGKIRVFVDFDKADDEPQPSQAYDSDGHGTHVAGIAAGAFSPLDEQGRLKVTEAFSSSLEGEYPQWLSFDDVPGVFEIRSRFTGRGSLDGLDLRAGDNPGIATGEGQRRKIGGWEQTAKLGSDARVTLNGTGARLHLVSHRSGNAGDLLRKLRFQWQARIPVPPLAPGDSHPFLSGVAPRSGLVLLRAVRPSDWISALEWVVQNRAAYGIGVVNLSQGTNSDVEALRVAIKKTVNAGVIVIAAAGNDGVRSGNQVSFPARYLDVEAVGALDHSGAVAGYSSQGGAAVHPPENIVAPALGPLKPDSMAFGGSGLFGGGIFSSDSNSGNTPGNWDQGHDSERDDASPLQGTSQAAPQVAALYTLLIEAQGGWEKWKTAGLADVERARALLHFASAETGIARLGAGAAGRDEASPSLDGTCQMTQDRHEGYGLVQPWPLLRALKRNPLQEAVREPLSLAALSDGKTAHARLENSLPAVALMRIDFKAGQQWALTLSSNPDGRRQPPEGQPPEGILAQPQPRFQVSIWHEAALPGGQFTCQDVSLVASSPGQWGASLAVQKLGVHWVALKMLAGRLAGQWSFSPQGISAFESTVTSGSLLPDGRRR